MRWKLLRRRLTISAPEVAVRSATPWPLRWAGAALGLGFCAAISLWAFEKGKDLAGLDNGGIHEELVALRDEVGRLKQERDKAQSAVNTSGSLITAERAAQERLAVQIRTLEAENRALRDQLGFFEKLMPAGGAESLAIRGLQAEVLGGQLRWQVLVMQPAKHASEFKGKLHVTVAGTLAGKPWTMDLPDSPHDLRFRQFRRLEGMVDLPEQAVVQNVSAKVVEGSATRAVQSIKLGA
ncbi:hypothetical protein EZ313_11765 [Ramlibacter henchirensis]|uniref:Uncharacterized protein n=1 Tax=Ramlibacter henchirensis TaxID=204072 RepID=A0A4Z0C6E7_9BURK|nr:DUF6776 family protein [Ramlibacter henchirensis]TFZ07246.1 hypothetical protein EZ313_11765 [Ramlibacter henchirensis]